MFVMKVLREIQSCHLLSSGQIFSNRVILQFMTHHNHSHRRRLVITKNLPVLKNKSQNNVDRKTKG